MVNIFSSGPPPWQNGGSQIEQFPSGLVKVTQSYLVPTATRQTYLAQFASGSELTGIDSPATDGLYIFPDPQCRDLNNGFSEINVTAYGRQQGKKNVELTYLNLRSNVNQFLYYCPLYRVQIVFRSGENPIPFFIDELLYQDDLYVTNLDGFSKVNNGREYSLSQSPATGYGVFQEYTYNMEVRPILL